MRPSIEQWLKEAKEKENSGQVGMYLTHVGQVRETARKQVRDNIQSAPVKGMVFSYDEEKKQYYIEQTLKMNGIFFVRAWLNNGTLSVKDDIMQVMIGADTRPHCLEAFNYLVDHLKNECVKEEEL